jgi:hypothetical protein
VSEIKEQVENVAQKVSDDGVGAKSRKS